MVRFKFQHLKELIFHGRTCCCCVPVRVGVIVLSFLQMFFSGILAIILWFEVANDRGLPKEDHITFAMIALVETLLLAASTLGFVGAVVRKQLFIQIYAYFIYFHLALSLGVALFLLYVVSKFSTTAAYKICLDSIRDSNAQNQCIGVIATLRYIYFAVSTLVFLSETYAAVAVARYVNQIQAEKRENRAVRRSRFEDIDFKINSRRKTARYSSLEDGEGLVSRSPGLTGFANSQVPGLHRPVSLHDNEQEEFNPYSDAMDPHSTPLPLYGSHGGSSSEDSDGGSKQTEALKREQEDKN
ncbi:hypothetical protein C8J56DRAFT_964862 [Mycena floridula]|nr:hypothetical protein C8J56DRAFT_964862 [Mycena floridula]